MAQGQKLVIDIDAICDFIFADDGRQVDTVIEETTDLDDKKTKTVRETKRTDRDHHEAIRFEIIKRLMDSTAEVGLDAEGSPEFGDVDSVACYNTLFQYGFYKTVNA